MFGRSGQGVERGRSADVADERRLSGCELLRDRSDRFVWHAEQDGGSAGSPFEVLVRHETDLDPRPLSGGGKGPAHASATDHSQWRAHGGGEVIPFQFPHRRYQTALLVRTSWRGFRSAPVRSRPVAEYREHSWPSSQSKSRERPGTPHSAHSGTFGAICERKPRPDGRGPELPSTWCRSTSSSASRAVTASRSWWDPRWPRDRGRRLPGVRLGGGRAPALTSYAPLQRQMTPNQKRRLESKRGVDRGGAKERFKRQRAAERSAARRRQGS